jgi:hypothetical protein
MRQISLALTVAITSALLGSWAYATEFSLPHISELDIADINQGLSSNSSSSYKAVANTASDVITSDRLTETDSLYYFTVVMPQHPESFSRLSFSELNQDNAVTPMQFDLINVQAFAGTPEASGQAIVTEGWVDETGTFWVEFNPSVPSGTTLTVALKAPKPQSSKSHEYGIAAYTATSTPTAIRVGNRTLIID